MNKVYLITGASSDIGMDFIRTVAEKKDGSVFIAHYRTENQSLLALKSDFPNTINLIQADFSHENSIFEIINFVRNSKLIPTHILHLPAGRVKNKRFKQIEWNIIQNEIRTEVHSLFEILKEFLPDMAKNKYGKIVVMLTSYTRNMPPKFCADYITAKYALMGLLKSAAAEYEGKGIFINAISPDMVQTKFLSNLDKRIIEANARGKPIGRNLKVCEVVTGINFLLSDDINCLTGENLFL